MGGGKVAPDDGTCPGAGSDVEAPTHAGDMQPAASSEGASPQQEPPREKGVLELIRELGLAYYFSTAGNTFKNVSVCFPAAPVLPRMVATSCLFAQ